MININNSPTPAHATDGMDALMQSCAGISPIATPRSENLASTMPERPVAPENNLLFDVTPTPHSNDLTLDHSMDEFILVPPSAVSTKFVLRPCASARYSFKSIGFEMGEYEEPMDEDIYFTAPSARFTADASMNRSYPGVTMLPIVTPPETKGPMIKPQSSGRSFNPFDEGGAPSSFIPIHDMDEDTMRDHPPNSSSNLSSIHVPRTVLQPRLRTISISTEDLSLRC
jgi:hypothetical protein